MVVGRLRTATTPIGEGLVLDTDQRGKGSSAHSAAIELLQDLQLLLRRDSDPASQILFQQGYTRTRVHAANLPESPLPPVVVLRVTLTLVQQWNINHLKTCNNGLPRSNIISIIKFLNALCFRRRLARKF